MAGIDKLLNGTYAQAITQVKEDMEIMGFSGANASSPKQNKPFWHFNGATQYLAVANNLNVQYKGDFSLLIRFRTNSNTIGYILDKVESATARGVRVEITSAGLIRFRLIYTATTDEASETTTKGFNDGLWHTVVFVKSDNLRTNWAIYVDGELQTVTYSGQILLSSDDLYNTGSLMLGRNSAGSQDYKLCDISDVQSFNYALSDEKAIRYSMNEPLEWVDTGGKNNFFAENFSSNTVSAWGKSMCTAVYNSGTQDCTITNAASGVGEFYTAIYMNIGRKYRVNFKAKSSNSTAVPYASLSISGALNTTAIQAPALSAVYQDYIYEGIVPSGGGSINFVLNSPNAIWTIDDIVITQLGCTFDLRAEDTVGRYCSDRANGLLAVGYNGVTDSNRMLGNSSILKLKNVTGDSQQSQVIPAGCVLEGVKLVNNTGNAVALKFGKTAGANDIVAWTLGANEPTYLDGFSNKVFSDSVDQDVYVYSTGWNGAAVDVTYKIRRIV